jgi:hypothetical protein
LAMVRRSIADADCITRLPSCPAVAGVLCDVCDKFDRWRA